MTIAIWFVVASLGLVACARPTSSTGSARAPTAEAPPGEPTTATPRPPSAGELRAIRPVVCADGHDERLDVVCSVGELVAAVPLGCDARPTMACDAAPPAFVALACRYEEGETPAVTYDAVVRWTSGAVTAVPSTARAPDTIAEGVTRREVLPDGEVSAAFDDLAARIVELGCRWHEEPPGTTIRTGFARCADVELWVTAVTIGASRLNIEAASDEVLDCEWAGIHGRTRARPGP